MQLTIEQETAINTVISIIKKTVSDKFKTVVYRLESMDPLQGNESLYSILLDILDGNLVDVADLMYNDMILEQLDNTQEFRLREAIAILDKNND
jgi:hypothetical protein